MTASPPAARAPRIAPGTRAEVGLVNWAICVVLGKASRTPPPNLFTTLGRQRGLFRGWLHFAGRLMPGGTLPRRETELVILRVAHLRGCTYEWEHHVRLGARAGITAAEVERLELPATSTASGWSRREAAVLAAVDELHAERDITDGTWAQLRSHLDERSAIELLLLVGHYEMLATTILTIGIEPDVHHRSARG